MRLIDADKLSDKAETWYKGAPTPFRKIYRSFVDIIAEAPTISPPPNDPLDLEELREMDGEPVWVQSMISGWAIVDAERGCCTNERGETAIFERYRELWLAYRRKPEEGGEMKIEMLETVRPDFPFLLTGVPLDTVLVYGEVYEATKNKYGAVCGICKNGQKLGVKPGEFAIVDEVDT